MNHVRFLVIFLPAALVLPLAALAIPESAVFNYVNWLEAAVLLFGGILAYRVAVSYRKDIRLAFFFLALYLVVFGLAVIMLPFLKAPAGAAFLNVVLGVQVVNYAMLVLCCVFILRMVDMRRLNLTGWTLFAVTLVVCVSVALYPLLSQPAASRGSIQYITEVLIRLVDAALVTALMPVIWLYVQHLRTQQQQSLTFTIIVAGIVFSTVFDFVFESLAIAFPAIVSGDSALYYLVREMIYAYGFSVIAIGLCAHLKHEDWGFSAIERALGR